MNSKKNLNIVELMKLINNEKVVAVTNKAADESNTYKLRRRALKELPKARWDVNSSLKVDGGNYMPSGIVIYCAKVNDGMTKEEFYKEFIKPCIEDDNVLFSYSHPVDDIIYIGIEEHVVDENWNLKIPLGRYLSSNIWVNAIHYDAATILPALSQWFFIDIKKIKEIFDIEDIKIEYGRK